MAGLKTRLNKKTGGKINEKNISKYSGYIKSNLICHVLHDVSGYKKCLR